MKVRLCIHLFIVNICYKSVIYIIRYTYIYIYTYMFIYRKMYAIKELVKIFDN